MVFIVINDQYYLDVTFMPAGAREIGKVKKKTKVFYLPTNL